MVKLGAVVLAAGQSTRMKSKRTKVLHDLAGRPVLSYPIAAARAAGAKPVVVVRGPQQKELQAYLAEAGVAEAVQRKPLGTGNAVAAVAAAFKGFDGEVLVLCGDAPLVRPETIKAFLQEMRRARATLGLVSMVVREPGMYGRVIRDLDGQMVSVVEARDAISDQLEVREVNSGIICAKADWLFKALSKLGNDNAKGEYYLTDLIGVAVREGVRQVAYRCADADELIGIDTRVGLARAAELLRERINKGHMLAGVGVQDFRHTYIDAGVAIGQDTVVMPHAFLQGRTCVGRDCTIENGVVLRDAVVGNDVHIKSFSVIEGSRLEAGAIVGPFARVRPGSKVGPEARIGNFVELKKCEMKAGAKANHLTYLGDATIGARTNIGCGTITCNYDGREKHRTVIGEEVFVGSDVQFIAPVRVGKGATIGAGSTITKNVPAGALGLSRAEQQNIRDWKPRKKKKR